MNIEDTATLELIDENFYEHLDQDQIKIYLSKILIQIDIYKRTHYSVAEESSDPKIVKLFKDTGCIVDSCLIQCYSKNDDLEGHKALGFLLSVEKRLEDHIKEQIPSKILIGSEILDYTRKGIDLLSRRSDYIDTEIKKNKYYKSSLN